MLNSSLVHLLLVALLICYKVVFAVDDQYFNACRAGDIAKVKDYLDSGISASSRDAKGNTGIIIAAGRGQTEVVKLLLKNGANVEDSTSFGIFEGKTALCWASSQGRADTVSYLIKAGANPQKPPDKGVFAGKNALMWAASQGRTDVVRLLIAAGVDVNYVSQTGNFKGKLALMWASSQGREETVMVLLEAGSDVNAVDSDGVSALMWASGSEASDENDHKKGLLEKATKGHIKVVQLLLKYNSRPDMRDKDGITAIMFAAYHGHTGAVKVLLNAGANADFMNKAGKTALQLARNSGHHDAANAIMEGPTFMRQSTLSDLHDWTTCGWLLSVMRAPVGTGIYSCTVRQYRQGEHAVLHGNATANNCTSPYSLENSCATLVANGLHHSLYHILEIVHGSSVEEVVANLGLERFAAVVLAKIQLRQLYLRHRKHFLWKDSVLSCSIEDADDAIGSDSHLSSSSNNCPNIQSALDKAKSI